MSEYRRVVYDGEGGGLFEHLEFGDLMKHLGALEVVFSRAWYSPEHHSAISHDSLGFVSGNHSLHRVQVALYGEPEQTALLEQIIIEEADKYNAGHK